MSRGADKPRAAGSSPQHEKITQEYVISVLGEPGLERQRPPHSQILDMVKELRQCLSDWDAADLLRLLDQFLWNTENALGGALDGVMQKGDEWTEHQSKQKKKAPQTKAPAAAAGAPGGPRGGRGGAPRQPSSSSAGSDVAAANGAPGHSRGAARSPRGASRGGAGRGRGGSVGGRGGRGSGAPVSSGKPVPAGAVAQQQQQKAAVAEETQQVPQSVAAPASTPAPAADSAPAKPAAAAASNANSAGPALRGAWAERAKKTSTPAQPVQPPLQQQQVAQQQAGAQGRKAAGARQQQGVQGRKAGVKEPRGRDNSSGAKSATNAAAPKAAAAAEESAGVTAKPTPTVTAAAATAAVAAAAAASSSTTTTTAAAVAAVAPNADQLPSPQILEEEAGVATKAHVQAAHVVQAEQVVESKPPTDPLFIAPGLPGMDTGSFHFRFGVYGHDDDVEAIEKEEAAGAVQSSSPAPEQAPVPAQAQQAPQPQQTPPPVMQQLQQAQAQTQALPPHMSGMRLDPKGQGTEAMPTMAHLPSFGPPGPFNPAGYMFPPHSMGPSVGGHPGSIPMMDHFPYNTLPTDPTLADMRMQRGGYIYDPQMQFHPYHPQQQQQQLGGAGLDGGQLVGTHGRSSPSVGGSHYGGAVAATGGSSVNGVTNSTGSAGGMEKYAVQGGAQENGLHLHGSHDAMMHQPVGQHGHHPGFPTPMYYAGPYGVTPGQFSFQGPTGPSQMNHMQRGGFYKPPGSPASGGYLQDGPSASGSPSFFNDVKGGQPQKAHHMYHAGDAQDVRGGGPYDKSQQGSQQGQQGGQQGQGQGQQGDLHKAAGQGMGGYPMPFAGFQFHPSMQPSVFPSQQPN